MNLHTQYMIVKIGEYYRVREAKVKQPTQVYPSFDLRDETFATIESAEVFIKHRLASKEEQTIASYDRFGNKLSTGKGD